MATLAEQHAFAKPHAQSLSKLGVQSGAVWERLGVVGRRAVLTAAGAVFALTCGAAAANVVRLPADMQSAAQPDEMTVQTELPSEAAARAYALENPPTMALKPDINADATPMSDATPDIATTSDDALLRTAYTTPAADDEDKTAPIDHSHGAPTDSAPVAADSSGA